MDSNNESTIGDCDRCNKKNIEVIADGYIVGFLCEDCYSFVHGE